MCGRFIVTTPPAEFARLFDARDPGIEPAPRYNVAPGTDILACRTTDRGERELALLHWGLIPTWSKDPGTAYKMINARAETVADKPAYRSAFRRRRCLIAADGFYEWKPAQPRKQPHLIRLRDGAPCAFAGLWEHWEQPGHAPIDSCTIIVTAANALVASIHDRMPVILAPEDYAQWLDPRQHDARALLPLLQSYPADRMESWPVGLAVNNTRNDDPRLIDRAHEGGGARS